MVARMYSLQQQNMKIEEFSGKFILVDEKVKESSKGVMHHPKGYTKEDIKRILGTSWPTMPEDHGNGNPEKKENR